MNPGEPLPSYFYIMPVLVLIIAGVPLFFTYKKNKVWFRILAFGFGFYLVNIALVLQFLSVGSAIISDRYSYISYIGLFFILACLLNELIQKGSESLRYAAIGACMVFTGFFGYLCFERTFAWSNTETMLTDVINQYPEKVPQAYKYLGIYYGENNRPKDAFNCYDVLINKMHLKDPQAYCNMGTVYLSLNNIKEAAKYFSASLQMDSTLFMSYLNLGEICADTGNFPAAFRYYDKAKSLYRDDERLYFNISLAHVATKQYAEAVNDYNILIGMNPDNAKYFYNRGIAEYSLGNKDAALEDFKKTLSMPVTPQNAQFHMDLNSALNLSVIYKERGDTKTASEYEALAQKLQHP
jgi:protein O-mannosyl-transferase